MCEQIQHLCRLAELTPTAPSLPQPSPHAGTCLSGEKPDRGKKEHAAWGRRAGMGAQGCEQGFKGPPGLSAASQGGWCRDGAMHTRASHGAGIDSVGTGSDHVL